MRIKELFIVPDGIKVTEKVFSRVLISSICSILLCMVCLAGTTWALFTVSIKNTDNVIQLADAPNCILQVDGQDIVSGEELSSGEHIIRITHTSLEDDLQKKSTLYVTFIVDDMPYGYIILGGDYPYSTNVTIRTEEPCALSWTVAWSLEDEELDPLVDNTIQITAKDSTDESTDPTDESTEPTDPTDESTEPTDPTDESTEATDPTDESTEATDPTDESTEVTDPTDESTEPTEPTDESTESTEPTDESMESTDPTYESTEPTDPTDESTEVTDPTDAPTAATDPTVNSSETQTQPTDGANQSAEQESSPAENES